MKKSKSSSLIMDNHSGDIDQLDFSVAETLSGKESKLKIIETDVFQDSRKRDGYLRMLVEHSAGLITIFTEDGKFTYCSPNVEAILGFTEEEFLKKSCLDLIPQDQHNSAKETWRTVFSSPDHHTTFIHKYLNSENGYRIFESSARSTVNNEGQKILILNSNDITDKFESNKKLKTSDEILNRVHSLVVMISATNDVTYVSPSVRKVLGFEPEELLGKGWWKKTTVNLSDAQNGQESVKMLLENGIGEKDRYNERQLMTSNGEIKWIAWENSKTPDGSIIGVGQDITEIKRLENEKNEIQKKTFFMLEELVTKRTEEVVSQRKIIEQKNKDITDSIQYAKRLQDAILPSAEHISSVFSENFIFFQPKDIVAGDFFWAHENDEFFMIAVADCTGHGVPGAMVSMVCSNALERAVNEYKLTDPGKILDKTTDLVLETFEKSAEVVTDGMDVSLLVLNKKTKEIFWAGANNALYFIQDDQLHKLPADKQPVGSFVYHLPFTTQQVKNTPGTIFYLLSDGFADQFGGPSGKKFMQKRLAQLLYNSRDFSLEKQNEAIKNVFSVWKGDFEQVDDVTIIGLRLDDKFVL